MVRSWNVLTTSLALILPTLGVARSVSADEFTWQGQLRSQGQVVNDDCDFRFRLYDAASGGTLLGVQVEHLSLTVVDGQIKADLDFGSSLFDGTDRWIEIDVRNPAGAGSFTTLSPRQKVTPSPYALFALSGNDGPEGPQGPVGPEGPQGIQGETGPQGIQGEVGPEGSQGIQGEVGPVGPEGPQGIQGEVGPQGPPGDSHWEMSGSATYYNAGSVGIGVVAPQYPLHVSSSGITTAHLTNTADTGSALRAESTRTTGSAYGVTGVIQSPQGIGVSGFATATSGDSTGVWGASSASIGRGVYGLASSSTGTNYGGQFQSNSTSGRGVSGVATASTGNAYGVYGSSNSTSGRGVTGAANASTGATIGGLFTSTSTSGYGIWATAGANNGTNYGIYAETLSPSGYAGYFEGGRNFFEGNVGIGTDDPLYPFHVETNASSAVYARTSGTGGRAVFGRASGIGQTFGGWFESDSSVGRGVYGLANANTGTTYGVWGLSASTSGRGVFGQATAGSGTTYGGRFESNSSSGFAGYFEGAGNDAVYIENTDDGRGLRVVAPSDTAVWAQTTTGFAAVDGETAASSGRGVYGHATHTTGINYGVFGSSSSPNGYDFYASGAGTNYGSASSRRWKSDIRNIDDPLDKLSQLRGVYYTWDQDHGGQHDVGFIAEEVGAVLPEVVQFEENGVDASGMDYSKMTPLLVEAVNALRVEMESQIAAKDAEIAALREHLRSLERRLEENAASRTGT